MSGASPSRDLPAAAPDPTARVAAPPGLLRIHEDAAETALTPRFIRDLRDDAGCSLAEIGLLLEDEEARIRDRERFRTAAHTAEKRTILRDLIARTDRQVRTLGDKAARLHSMIEAADVRRAHLRAHLDEQEGGTPAHDPAAPDPVAAP